MFIILEVRVKLDLLFVCYNHMEEDIKNSILILALNNLIEDIDYSLEEEPEYNTEYYIFIRQSAEILLNEFGNKLSDKEPVTPRPKWNQ